MERYDKIIIVFNYFWKKKILNLSDGSEYLLGFKYARVFWIFVNFCKYDRFLKMRRDAIMEELWIFQDYEYARFLHIQALYNVPNIPE